MAVKIFFLNPTLPKQIYLDTNVLVYALSGEPPENLGSFSPKEQKKFKEVIIAKRFLGLLLFSNVTIKVSSMLFPEFWRSILINEITAGEKCTPDKALGYLGDDPHKYISKYISHVENADKKLAEFFKTYGGKIEVKESSEEISKKALFAMKEYTLDTYDAIHIGTALVDKINDFATGDQHIVGHCSKTLNIWTYPVPAGGDLDSVYKEAKKQIKSK